MLNKQKLLTVILILMFILCPLNAHANKNISTNLNGNGKITTVYKGQKAPFDGYLLDTIALVKMRLERLHLKKQCELDIKYINQTLKNENKVKLSLCENNLKYEKKTFKQINITKDKEIKQLRKLNSKSGINLTPLWITISFVAGAAITIGIVAAVKPIIFQNNNQYQNNNQ